MITIWQAGNAGTKEPPGPVPLPSLLTAKPPSDFWVRPSWTKQPRPTCQLTTDSWMSQTKINRPGPSQQNGPTDCGLESNNECLLFYITTFWGNLFRSNSQLIYLLIQEKGTCVTGCVTLPFQHSHTHLVHRYQWNSSHRTDAISGPGDAMSLLSWSLHSSGWRQTTDAYVSK